MVDAVRAYIQTRGLDVGQEQSDPSLHQGRPLSLSPLRAVLAEARRTLPNPTGVDMHLL